MCFLKWTRHFKTVICYACCFHFGTLGDRGSSGGPNFGATGMPTSETMGAAEHGHSDNLEPIHAPSVTCSRVGGDRAAKLATQNGCPNCRPSCRPDCPQIGARVAAQVPARMAPKMPPKLLPRFAPRCAESAAQRESPTSYISC